MYWHKTKQQHEEKKEEKMLLEMQLSYNKDFMLLVPFCILMWTLDQEATCSKGLEYHSAAQCTVYILVLAVSS